MWRGLAARMAKKKIKPIDLNATVNDLLNQYGNAVFDVLKGSVEEVSQEAVEKLQSVKTFAPGGHPSGAYSASWTCEDVPTGRLTTKTVVHNGEHYRLTHLLEKGHVSRNGTGRTFGRVPAYPHIAPVNDWAKAELPKLVEGKIKQI